MEKTFLYISLAGALFSYFMAERKRDAYTYLDGKERPFEIWFFIMYVFIFAACGSIWIITQNPAK